jgi:8-oxo-dGTP diphosphatase
VKSKDQRLLEEAYEKVLGSISGVKKQPYWYLGANSTVDLVVIYKRKILLIQRKAGGVEGGKWAIPGGFIDTKSQKGEVYRIGKESPKEAALREVQEETNLDLSSIPNISSRLKEVGVYEGNSRDPRDNEEAWSKSYAFTITLNDDDGVDFSSMRGLDDASDAKWFPIERLPSNLAFDHSSIIQDALNK